MDQELMMRAQQFDARIKELQENLEFIETQISELNSFKEDITSFSKFEGKEIISSIGKGIYISTEIKSKKLLVEVGAGIALNKSPEDAKDIIESQLSKIKIARINILGEIDSTQMEFQNLLMKLQSER